MYQKILADIKNHPEKHLVLIGTILSLVMGLCAWQYCRGYFDALGITISYSHVDNLVFAFQQISSIPVHLTRFNPSDSWWFLVFAGPALILGVYLIKFVNSKTFPEAKSDATSVQSVSHGNRKWIFFAAVEFVVLFSGVVYLFSLSAGTYIALVPMLGVTLISFVSFVRCCWNGSFVKKPSKPIAYFLAILIAVNFFYQVGRLDGERLQSQNYRFLDTVCLSGRHEPTSKGLPSQFSLCGKLVYSDSQRICIKEIEPTFPSCRKKEQYEITIIPNST